MNKGVASSSLQILLLLLVFSFSSPVSTSENYCSPVCVTGKEIMVSPGNTTIHYVYFKVTDGRLHPFLLFNVTVSEPGWYHLEIWVDMFNPSDERWGMIKYVFENKAIFIPRMLRPYLIHWPIDMIEFVITEEFVRLGTFDYTWQPITLYLSAHEYRKYAMWIVADFEAVKPGIIEVFLWDTSDLKLEWIVESIREILTKGSCENNVLKVAPINIAMARYEEEMSKLPKPLQPLKEFDIVVRGAQKDFNNSDMLGLE